MSPKLLLFNKLHLITLNFLVSEIRGAIGGILLKEYISADPILSQRNIAVTFNDESTAS